MLLCCKDAENTFPALSDAGSQDRFRKMKPGFPPTLISVTQRQFFQKYSLSASPWHEASYWQNNANFSRRLFTRRLLRIDACHGPNEASHWQSWDVTAWRRSPTQGSQYWSSWSSWDKCVVHSPTATISYLSWTRFEAEPFLLSRSSSLSHPFRSFPHSLRFAPPLFIDVWHCQFIIYCSLVFVMISTCWRLLDTQL